MQTLLFLNLMIPQLLSQVFIIVFTLFNNLADMLFLILAGLLQFASNLALFLIRPCDKLLLDCRYSSLFLLFPLQFLGHNFL
jgi:hypothetical protein